MPIRIPELPPTTITNPSDLLPISQYNGAKRVTYKITATQLRDFINIDPNIKINDLYSKIGSLGNNKVSVSGDTMTGFLTLHSKPQQPYHAASKNYVDEVAANLTSGTGTNYVHISGEMSVYARM